MFTILNSYSIVISTLTYGLTCWGGNLFKQDRQQLNKITNTTILVIVKEQEDVDTIYEYRN